MNAFEGEDHLDPLQEVLDEMKAQEGEFDDRSSDSGIGWVSEDEEFVVLEEGRQELLSVKEVQDQYPEITKQQSQLRAQIRKLGDKVVYLVSIAGVIVLLGCCSVGALCYLIFEDDEEEEATEDPHH